MVLSKKILILLCFLSEVTFGQVIRGTIKTPSGNAIAFAKINVLNTNIETLSDSTGQFTLNLTRGNYQVCISAKGYASKLQPLAAWSRLMNLDIILQSLNESISDVFVTANKEEKDILQTASAITSISAQQIKDSRILSLSNLVSRIPNYMYIEYGVGFQQLQNMRGIQSYHKENAAVVTYIDGVNNMDILANGMVLSDIERIEVLRGAQGTLFGRNAIGGVINIVTKQPTNRTEYFAEAGIGNLSAQRYAIGYKTPLIKNKLFFGANALYQSRLGHWRSIIDVNRKILGERVGGENNLYGSFYLKWIPSTKFSAIVNVKTQQDWSDNSALFMAQSYIYTEDFPYGIDLYYGMGKHKRNIFNTALTLKYFGKRFSITSTSTTQQIGLSYKNIFADVGERNFPYPHSYFFYSSYSSYFNNTLGAKVPAQNVFSHELRLNGKGLREKLQYTMGTFYFSQIGHLPSANAIAISFDPDSMNILRNKSVNSGVAVFGELSYKIAKKFSITAGMRYDDEKAEKTFNGIGESSIVLKKGILMEREADTTAATRFTAFSPKLSFLFAQSKKLNLYASFSRGFRAGGVNYQKLPDGILQEYKPEYTDNYELGYKGQFFKNRLSIASTVFYTEWRNIQYYELSRFIYSTYFLKNVGNADSRGLEFEVSAIPFKGLQIDGSFGFVSAYYRNFIMKRYIQGAHRVMTVLFDGAPLINAPRYTGFLGIQYSMKLRNKFDFTVRGEGRNIGQYRDFIGQITPAPNQTILNINMSLSYRHYSLSVWSQNLLRQPYFHFEHPDMFFATSAIRSVIPNMLGVMIKAEF